MACSKVDFLGLPCAVHFQILGHLDYKDFVNCSKTCNKLLELCEEDLYWKKLYRRYWDDNFIPNDEKTWKDAFVEEYQDKKKYIHFYKKVKHAWDVIKNSMDQVDTAITSSLIGGMSEEELDRFEAENGISLPTDLRCVYRFHRGQFKGRRNGIFGVVQNYDYFRTESLLPLKVDKTSVGIPCVAVTGNENVQMLCLLEDRAPLETGNFVTASPPASKNFLVLAKSFLDYFLDYAKKLEENYFPIVDGRIYRFYKDPSSVSLSYDVKVEVSTAFLPEFSVGSYAYAYLVRFTMDNNVPQVMSCRLMTRHWEIIEEDSVRAVDGPGVIGMKPVFKPGTEFSYISCTTSQLPKTSMKGHYTVTNLASGLSYNITIPEFHMNAGPFVTLEDC